MVRVRFDPDDQQPLHSTLKPPLWLWGGLALLGLLVFELTMEPALGMSVFCLRFGWEDLRTARWLRHADSFRIRSVICRWFLLARAGARISIAAFCVPMMGLTLQILLRGPPPPAPPRMPMPEWFPVLMLVLVAAVLGTTLCGSLGIWRSRRAGLPVWLDPVLYNCASQRRWPPEINEFGVRNLVDLPWLLLMSVWLTLLFLGSMWVALASVRLLVVRGWPGAEVLGSMIGLVALGLGVWLLAWMLNGVRAHRPAECWQRSPSSLVLR